MKQLLITAFFCQLLLAAPAFQGERTFTQPSGETITYHPQGDEHLHWLESGNGEIMLYSKKNKRIESAIIKDNTLKPSGNAISQINRSASTQNSQNLTKKEVLELQQNRRIEHLSKMKRAAKLH